MNAQPFARTRPESCLSDRLLDRLRLGELSDLEREAAHGHLAGCSLCQRQRAELDLAPTLLPNLATGERAHGRRPSRIARPMVGLLLAAAAGVVLMVRARPREAIGDARAPGVASGTQIKGGPFSFQVIVRHAASGRIEPLVEGATLSAGDALRFRVYAPQGGYLAVVDLDGAGAVSPFVPAGGGALPLVKGGAKVLDGSVVLDGAPGDERLIAVLCPTAAEAARSTEVARAALKGAHGATADVTRLDLDCFQTQIRFRKQPPP